MKYNIVFDKSENSGYRIKWYICAIEKTYINTLGISCDSHCHGKFTESTGINLGHKGFKRMPTPHSDITDLSLRSTILLCSGTRGYDRSLSLVILYQLIKLLCMNVALKLEMAINRIFKGSRSLHSYNLERNQ